MTIRTRPGPTPPISSHAIHTSRLILEPLTMNVLPELWKLRSSSKTMLTSMTGKPDASIEATAEMLSQLIESCRTDGLAFAVRLRGDVNRSNEPSSSHGEEVNGQRSIGVFLGTVAITPARDAWDPFSRSWPSVGYGFDSDHWRRGYGFEAVNACVQAWWALPHLLRIDGRMIGNGTEATNHQNKSEESEEWLVSTTEKKNLGSWKILLKCGFTLFQELEGHDDWRGPYVLQDWRMPKPAEDSNVILENRIKS